MNFDSIKEKNLLNLNIMRCNKIKIKSIKCLIPLSSSKKDKHYIKLTANNSNPQISNIFSFYNSSEVKINQSFSLETFQEKIIKEIKFELINTQKNKCEFKASILNQNFILDEKTGDNIIYLSNEKGEEFIIIYYSVEYKAIDSFEFFDKSVKYNESANKNYYLDKNWINIAQDDNIKNEFIQNLIYIEIIIDHCYDLINWKNYLDTLFFLISISFIILYYKFAYILLPLLIVFFHIRKKNQLINFLKQKNSEENKNRSKLFYIKLKDEYNNLIEKYELFIKKIFTGKKSDIIKIYKALLLTVLSNIFFFYFRFFHLINRKRIYILFIWIFFLSRNSICIKIYYIIKEIFSPITSRLSNISKLNNFFKFISNIFFPMYTLYNKSISEDNSDTYISLVKSQGLQSSTKNVLKSSKGIKNNISKNSGNNLIKFELYENERWWVIAGWTKNLMGMRPTWCRVDKPDEFCDKSKIFLPSDENNKYQWSADWKIEINNGTDDNGWEYADDLESPFGKDDKYKYIRRRKWVRYANKI
jgi:hypothetical protein